MTDPRDLWLFLPIGYLLSVLIETPVLVIGLSPRHSLAVRVAAGLWLTACTYPIVILVLRPLLDNRSAYLAVAETFAPVAECVLFWLTFGQAGQPTRGEQIRDAAVIVLANLLSFGAGLLMDSLGWFAWLET